MLLLASLLAIVCDLHITSHGGLAAAGTVGLTTALAWLLFISVPTWVAAPVTLAMVTLLVTAGRRALYRWHELMRRPTADPAVGRIARVAIRLQPDGWVKVDGVYWRATSPGANLKVDDPVLIVSRSELTLAVVRLEDGEAALLRQWDPASYRPRRRR